MDTPATRAVIRDGRAVQSGDASPSAQAWLRREAAAGRVKRLTGLVGWCPAHPRWVFWVSANHAPAFVEACRDEWRAMVRAAALDEAIRGRIANANRLLDLAA